ncbi:MAG: DUF928 domain-containing protein [Cyanobacteria bacterium J06598_1]
MTRPPQNPVAQSPVQLLETAVPKILGVAGCTCLLLSMALPGLAAYRKPETARPPNTATSTSGGRNGGVASNGLQLTPLAPQQHVGQSVSAHPTFTWFVPNDRTLPGEFQLYEMTAEGRFQRVLEQPYEFTSEQGFMSFALPDELKGLTPNTQYVWQVLLRYGERPSDIYKVRSQIEIVSAASRTPQPLATDLLAQIEQFSEAGLWYDALALVSELPATVAEERRDLLLLELAAVEAATEIESSDGGAVETFPADAENAQPVTDVSVEAAAPFAEKISAESPSHSQALRLIAAWEKTRLSSFLSELIASHPPA